MNKKKYHLVKWADVCRPKDIGGLGIQNLHLMNKALLCNWWWKIYNIDGVWQQLLKNKYQRDKCLTSVKHKQGDSQFWSDLLKHKNFFFSLCRFTVGNCKNTRFWADWWIGQKSLQKSFPILYSVCFDKNKSIAEIFDKEIQNVSFRRTLYGESLQLWEHIKNACENIVLTDQKDVIKWSLAKNGLYTVKSCYRSLI